MKIIQASVSLLFFVFAFSIPMHPTSSSENASKTNLFPHSADPSHVPAIEEAHAIQSLEYLYTKKEELLNDLDYFSSKGIDFEFPTLSDKIKLHYKARWGYRGSGDENQPFKGFTGHLTIPVTIAQGLIIDPLQAHRSKEIIQQSALARLINVSPTDEFKLKLFTLLISVGREEIASDLFCTELKKLLKRAARTPNFQGVEFRGLRLVGTNESPGYLDSLAALPTEVFKTSNAWFTQVLKVLTPLFGLAHGHVDAAALKKLISSISYTENTALIIPTEQDRVAHIEFGYKGLGHSAAPFMGCFLHIELPFAKGVNNVVEKVHPDAQKTVLSNVIVIPLGPVWECCLKIGMLLCSALNGTFPMHAIPSELESLTHRLLITPNIGDVRIGFGEFSWPLLGTAEQPGLLRILALNARHIMNHDFSISPTDTVSSSQAVTVILSIIYKAFTDYTALRLRTRVQLMQTPDGKKVLSELHEAMTNFEKNRTAETKELFHHALAKYQVAERALAKNELEAIVRFVMREIAKLAKRWNLSVALGTMIKEISFIKELEKNGINVDVSEFWQEFAR